MLLCIDTELLKSNWISEDLKGQGEEFPHIYGNINIDAIVEVFDIQSSIDGLVYENDRLKSLIKNVS